jgi:hypothetical protein
MVKNRCFTIMFVFSWSLRSQFCYIHAYILIISESLQHVWNAPKYQPVVWICHTYSFFTRRAVNVIHIYLVMSFFNIAQEMCGLFVSYVWSKKSWSSCNYIMGEMGFWKHGREVIRNRSVFNIFCIEFF